MIKIVTVVGARPQFIKAAAVSRAISSKFADKVMEVLVHTGQHYDEKMSQVFFDELGIPQPKYRGWSFAMRGKYCLTIFPKQVRMKSFFYRQATCKKFRPTLGKIVATPAQTQCLEN